MKVCDCCGSVAVDVIRTSTETFDVCLTHKQMILDLISNSRKKEASDDEGRTPATA